MMLDRLPDGAYLAWRYVDERRTLYRAQVYWDDGRVEAIDGTEHELVCCFSPEQAEGAREAVLASGLPRAADRSRDDVWDTAVITYWWRVGTQDGIFINAAYPAERPLEIERLEARLAELEQAAGGWPLLADE